MRWGDLAASTEPIVAIASPPGNSPRGIVRVSGTGAIGTVQSRLASGELPSAREMRKVVVRARVGGAEVEVPAIALVMVGPSSFTGQDTVELLMAGSSVLLWAVVEAMCDPSRGSPSARHANPGEFSARAYLNGKLDLNAAESIAASIGADSDAQLRAARSLRSGVVGGVAEGAASRVTEMLALVEAGIDFSDQEDVVAISPGELVRGVTQVEADLASVVARSAPEEVLRALPVIALRGPPNAGKSSLFNALVGHGRAIESEVAGSTRDAIVEPIQLSHGREVLLVDLPGIEDPQGALAAQVQDLAHASLRGANLQVHCTPPDAPAHTHSGEVWVVTKADLLSAQARAALEGSALLTSARTGEGIDALRDAICNALGDQSSFAQEHAPIMLERHRGALAAANSALARVREAAQACVDAHARGAEPAELIADDLREALDALGIVAGTRTPDDVLDALFARFCIGK